MASSDRPRIDWDAATEEATDILSRYIALNTSNPPGNEEEAALFLRDILEREGIEVTIYEAAPGRANLSARLPGTGDGKPLVLLNHTDVVPAEAQFWQEEPFAGTVRDGVIWGRGALDMKGMAVMELMSLLLLRRHRVSPKRDVVFLAVADEEAGGDVGIDWLDHHHPELLEAEFVLNEGAYGFAELLGVRRPVFNCAVGEKGPLWVRLRTHGVPGHGSVPHEDNCLDRLIRVLYKVQGWRRPMTVVPELRTYFDRLYGKGFLPEQPTDSALARTAETNPIVRALLTNTVSITGVRGGIKHNVIPGVAEATLDCRLLPGQDPDAFVEELRAVIDDDRVDLELVLSSNTPSSAVQTRLFEVAEEVTREHVEDALVAPIISPGFTDSRVFRKRGVTAYGFIPILLEPLEAATIHGHNERISIDNLRLGTQILFEVTRRLCT